jgi:hypothetical protein
MTESVSVNCKFLRLSSKAIQIEYRDAKNKIQVEWIPKKLVLETDCLAVNDAGYVVVPRWLAVNLGVLDAKTGEQKDR